MKCAELSASAGSAAERNLSNGAPAAPRAVGRGEINGAGGAFGASRKRASAAGGDETDGGLEDFDIPHQSLSATASPRRSRGCRKTILQIKI